MDLSSLATHAQRLSARLSENIAERSKDLGLDPDYNLSNPSTTLNIKLPILAHAHGLLGSSPRLWERLAEIASAEGELETKRLLGSKSEPDRVDGLKRVTLMMCRNRSVLPFFPFVTNCLHSPTSSTAGPANHSPGSHSFTIRHLVSIYLLQHSHLSPDLALLSVNAWQKDLADPSPIMRSLALRTLAGMGLESVLPLVVVSIDRLVNDPNWFVKRTVAEALITVCNMDPDLYRSRLVEGPLKRLLKDRSPLVLGSALVSWEALCPHRWDLIHKQFRHYCAILVDADENGQHVMMRVLTRYVREHFKQPDRSSALLEPDIEKFLSPVTALLKSRSPAVVIAATNALLFLAPPSRFSTIVPALIRLVEEKSAEKEEETLLIILRQINQIIKFTTTSHQSGHLFKDKFENFLICTATDSLSVKIAKLEILASFVSSTGGDLEYSKKKRLLDELRFYTWDSDPRLVRQVVRKVGEMVKKTNGKVRLEGLELLVESTKSVQHHTVSESITVLRALLVSDPSTSTAVLPTLQNLVPQLVQLLVTSKLTDDGSRANLYWLISETSMRSVEPPPVFMHFYKYSISNFVRERDRSKLQILSLVAKSMVVAAIRRHEGATLTGVLFDHRRTYELGFEHLMRLARYDGDYNVRDRARFLSGLVGATSGMGGDDNRAGLVELSDDDGRGGVRVLSAEAAFAQGHSLSAQASEGRAESMSRSKMSARELEKILIGHESERSDQGLDERESSRFEPNSLYGMLGLHASEGAASDLKPGPWRFLDWNTVPEWTSVPLDASSRDADEEGHSQGASMVHGFRSKPDQQSSVAGFVGSGRGHEPQDHSQKGREKVVLVPTLDDEDGEEIVVGGRRQVVGGYRNLDDFLMSSESEEGDYESESGSEDDISVDEEEEGSSEGEEDSNEEEQSEEQNQSNHQHSTTITQ